MTAHPKRLIEVDLPIKEISAHARREKSIRHGHISTLHIWWARRPLAACRAVICAALWPDPLDENCPQAFRDAAAKILCAFAEKARTEKRVYELVQKHYKDWNRTSQINMDGKKPTTWAEMQKRLLDFIADFANWDASTVPEFLETARALTQAAHEALGGAPGTRPLVVDPFAGGGSIPLEALRVGADAFASDLNPVAVLLNKVVLEYIPKYGNAEIVMKDAEGKKRTFSGLAEAVRYWGNWVKEQAEKELAEFYPTDPDGSTPIAYLWARTIKCEGPACGAEVPLLRSLWLAKKANRSVAFKLEPDKKKKRVEIQIIDNCKTKDVREGTVQRGSATCPCCGYTTPAERVRAQLRSRSGGSKDARLTVVIKKHPSNGTQYSFPQKLDVAAAKKATDKLAEIAPDVVLCGHSFIPNEPTPTNQSHRSVGSLWIYGMRHWSDIYTDRQLLVLGTLCQKLSEAAAIGMSAHVHAMLAICVGKIADYFSTLCLWRTARSCVAHTFGRQALPIVWDFGEMNPFAGSAGDWSEAVNYLLLLIDAVRKGSPAAKNSNSALADATKLPFPDDSADVFGTDPPYYDSVVYAELSDYFYVWLKRAVPRELAPSFSSELTPKERQAVVYHPNSIDERINYERLMGEALTDGRRVLKADGIGFIVFAHKSTSGWETLLQALIGAGWIVTASWPVDTERGGRMNAYETASLASSIHLVCRPRENPDGSVHANAIGDWRDILAEVPVRIHEWMPRLREENVVGADAIFACLGPALEVFSRYSRVERANGEAVTLREYLEQVWAAVSKEALSMIFEGADATGFEEDARLTAMWLWTLGAGGELTTEGSEVGEESAEDEEEEEKGTKGKLTGGFLLEYDAALKIARGLGAHLEALHSLVEVKGDKARLRPVSERAAWLFGKPENDQKVEKKKDKLRAKKAQLAMFEPSPEETHEQAVLEGLAVEKVGDTTLDRVHQAMLLFGTGRGDALKRFLVDDGAGRDAKFWKLAQALVALYPQGTEERRWAEGLQARKKGLGL
jgi:adenine-specific DNA methylase